MFYLDPPFNMEISGMTGTGKTHFVLDLLQNEYKNKFDYVIIVCPTFDYNRTYERKFIFEDPDIIPIIIKDKLNDVLEKLFSVYKDKKEQTLIIIDDCANLQDAKQKATALTKLAFHGRHANISTWVLTQKYNAIVKDFRQNIGMLVLFYDKDKESREAAFKENDIGLSADDKENIIKTLKDCKGSKVILRLVQPFEFLLL
jgi:Cdc6-like AAA superfamily ATPase